MNRKYRRGNHNGPSKNRHPELLHERGHLSFKRVSELYAKCADDIILSIIDRNFNFDKYMQAQSMSNDLIILMIRLLNKGFTSQSLKHQTAKIIAELIKSNFLSSLVYGQLDKKDVFGNYNIDFIREVIELVSYILVNNPSNTISIKPIMDSIEVLVELRISEQELMDLFDSKIRRPDNLLKTSKAACVMRPKVTLNNAQASITEIQIIPTLKTIINEENPFLRANLIVGPYESVNDYLDVHFRLLREDYLLPLRQGIRAVRNIVSELTRRNPQMTPQVTVEIHKRLATVDSIYAYSDVKINVDKAEDLNYFVELPVKKAKGIQWERTKRFLFGSLVFLSKNYFENSFLVGVIVHTDIGKKKRGQINIQFDKVANDETENIDLTAKYIMLETSALFESYKHVLYALQSFTRLDEAKFPFKQHLVDSNNVDMLPPDYLSHAYLDFSPLLSHKRGPYPSNSVHRWPTAAQFNLDSSQYDALKLTLTKKLAIIQGPPGTGKTFIGVKLLQFLLHNKNLWCNRTSDRSSPILMICYTNHALDQFLELCMNECNLRTGIVRVGGRSKSEKLTEFLLKNLKTKARIEHKMDSNIHFGIRNTFKELKMVEESIKSYLNLINLASNSILKLSSLSQYMSPEYEDTFEDDTELLFWLGFNDPNEQMRIQIEQMRLQEQQAQGEAEVQDEVQEDEAIDDDNEENENRMLEDDLEPIMTQPKGKTLVLKTEISSSNIGFSKNDIIKMFKTNDGWMVAGKKKNNDPNGIHFDKIVENLSDHRNIVTFNLWQLDLEDRIKLYRHWVSLFTESFQRERTELKLRHDQLKRELEELRQQEDRFIMQQSHIVAMTTTGSARYHSILRDIGPRIVIVEEAAEVFEAHVVASLSEKCEHLILIGDHVQLRPKPNVYTLEKDYHLDVSLFERLILNGVPSVQLNTQHRMRPEISVLMKHFYERPIKDGERVFNYPSIIGVTQNIAFIRHTHAEETQNDGQSKYNMHEIHYLIAFCKYLLKQKYEKSQITVLVTYLGQFYHFRDELRKNKLQEIKCSTVDNFQGEENDIILLSLVRSNYDKNIGFLKVKNRVCVALSRAKWGFFCIGNFEMLKDNSMWREILTSERDKSKLILSCVKHPENNIVAQKPSDFDSRLEGGCSKKCDYRFDCGHACARFCHLYDPKHETIKCPNRCERMMGCGHRCQDACGHKNECDESKCNAIVTKTLPCNHTQALKCKIKPEKSDCNQRCAKVLSCGHKCTRACKEKCDPCETMCLTQSLCQHKSKIQVICGTPAYVFQMKCDQPCGFQLECGHLCTGKCGECYGGRVHVSCSNKCSKLLICGHPCVEPCSNNCGPCKKMCRNKCAHSQCQNRCGALCTPCFENCQLTCEHKKCTNKCYQICDREPCDEPCKQLLKKCNHPCIGYCGEPCPTLCRICDRAQVTEVFFGNEDEPNARFVQLEDCRHVIESEGLKAWLEQDTDEITLPTCPKCKTPIRKNSRFSKYLKRRLFYIEKIKAKYIGEIELIKQERHQLLTTLRSSNQIDYMDAAMINSLVSKLDSRDVFMSDLVEVKNKMSICEKIFTLEDSLKKSRFVGEYDKLNLNYEILKLKSILQSADRKFTKQCFNDIAKELQRLKKYFELTEIENLILPSKKNEASKYIDTLYKLLVEQVVSYGLVEKDVELLFNKLRPLTSGLKISEDEKTMILQAFDLKQGHWFKCPNGHVYIITECGGAMERGKCNECNAEIGGNSHTVLSSNSLASEMDGARFPAWSDQANDMRNFEI